MSPRKNSCDSILVNLAAVFKKALETEWEDKLDGSVWTGRGGRFIYLNPLKFVVDFLAIPGLYFII